ncbi:glycoside hydrolase family 127 protein [Dyadobacter chenwenxiniae]|uniref:Glycoside hydrolase family 127 protein n=1 Tax=Dyadobacter chenwenxiniae TaxID=2906456 RepID=A0A9X1TFS9_9BACT|nr:beta-L-arabinofuranosidase domain-containing protein [Dyadobacter chenwenxiniae]MCF0063297.1 glycoside hydrolase family 127 protein [Dyadobacter chenwenxiniae]UON86355.1 glycoside hydrolase family 127 protein [Dyadobacter chenwenxiniae]
MDSDVYAQRIQPVGFSEVSINDNFWKPKQEKVATATLNACIIQTEEKSGRIRNFEKVARKQGEKHEGIYYDDSDVYKAIEAMAYSLKNRPDAVLEKKADEWIDKIAAAQQSDGYLNTYYTLTDITQRWTDMEKHEDYCAGHLMEAAVAYYNTTGKRKLLDVAIRFADHIDSTFRVTNRPWVSGHQEVELALMKMYHLTEEDRYLKLADWFLEQRGHGNGKGKIWDEWKDPKYCQDDVPVKQQKEITGHAVRAMYQYTGAADVASVTQDPGYLNAMTTVWEDVVYRNMYLTGGIGSSGQNEGFTADYDLPNGTAYSETCASVGMVFWNQRMNALTGDAKYIDVLERSLYNGALDGLSLTGDLFFYGNPLSSIGNNARNAWFGTACCPSNIARLVASVGDYIYGKAENKVWVNLFVGSSTRFQIGKTSVPLRMETAYPWDGNVKITMTPSQKVKYALNIRIPGWAANTAVPGELYSFKIAGTEKAEILLNGKSINYQLEKGYAVIDRTWQNGDEIELKFPMEVRQIKARKEVKANEDRIALQRGPLVYCVEGADNAGEVWNLLVPENPTFSTENGRILDEPVIAIKANLLKVEAAADGLSVQAKPHIVTAIPYYTWANRGKGPMQVWMPSKMKNIRIAE